MKTRDQGLLLHPDKSCGLECYIDADLAGLWNDNTLNDPTNAHCRTGLSLCMQVVQLCGVLNFNIDSIEHAEYIVLSPALCEVIAVMNLLTKIKGHSFIVHQEIPKVVCHIIGRQSELH